MSARETEREEPFLAETGRTDVQEYLCQQKEVVQDPGLSLPSFKVIDKEEPLRALTKNPTNCVLFAAAASLLATGACG